MQQYRSLLAVTLTLSLSSATVAGGIFSSASELRSSIQKKKTARLLKTIQTRATATQRRPAKRPVGGKAYKQEAATGGLDVLSQFDAPISQVNAPMPDFKPRARPPRRRVETVVYAPDEIGARVAVRRNDLKLLGPPEAEKEKPAPDAPRSFSPGRARLRLDARAGLAELHWTFDRLSREPARLRLAPPPGVRHLELDGSPLSIDSRGEVLIEEPGEHTLVLVYAANVSGSARWGRAEAWVPSLPRIELNAELPGTRLVASVDRARSLSTEDAADGTRVRAFLPPGGPVRLSWEERGVALDLGSAPPTLEEADLSAEAVTVYRMRGKDLMVETAVRFNAGPPGVNRLRVAYDPTLEILAAEDAGGKPWPRLVVREEGGVKELLLGLPARQSGAIVVKLRFAARPEALAGVRAGGESTRLPLPRVRPVDVGRAPEYLGIVKDPRTRVRLRGSFQAKDRTELPQWCPRTVAAVDGPVGRFSGPQPVALDIEPLTSIPTHYFKVLQASAITLLSRQDEEALTRVEYQLQNSVEQFLRVDLPGGARLLGAEVRGEPVKPGTLAETPGAILLALPTARSAGTREPEPIQVSIAYTTPIPRLRGAGKLDLELCRPEVPVERTGWTIYHPRGLVLEHKSGRFQPPARSYMEMDRRWTGKGSRSMPQGLAKDKESFRMQAQMNVANIMPNLEDPSSSDASRDLGLLPVEIRLPGSDRLRGMGRFLLEQGSVSRGSRSWGVKLTYVNTARVRRMAEAGRVAVAIGVLLLLLSFVGTAPAVAGLVAILLGLALGAAAHGAKAGMLKLVLRGLFMGIAGGVLWTLATPFRRLRAAALLLLLGLAGSLPAAPGRLEVLVPVPEKGPKALVSGGSTRVLVRAAEVEALEKALEARKKPGSKRERNEILYGDQEISGTVEDETAGLKLRLPLRVRGPGPWRLIALRGDLAVRKATLRKGRGAAKPVSLAIERDRGQQDLETQALNRYAGYLSGRSETGTRRNRIGYRLEITEPSPEAFTAYLLEIECVVPVTERADGGFQVELEPPAAAARKLILNLPDEVRVQVAGDARPALTERVEQTRVVAYPRRSGKVEVTWHPRAGHARRRVRRPPPPPEAPGEVPGATAPVPAPTPVAPTPVKEEDLWVLADWETQIEIGEEQVRGVARANLSIRKGSLDLLTLTAPPGVKVVDVEGPRVAEHRPLEETDGRARYGVRFQSRRKGSFPVKVDFRLPLDEPAAGKTTRRFRVPDFLFQECKDQRGRVGLRIQGSQEVRPVVTEGFEPASTRKEEVLAYSAVRSPRKLELEVENLPPAQVFPATVTSSQATTKFLDGETRRISLTFTVKNNGQDFLTFRLPEGTIQNSLELVRISGPGGHSVLPRVLDRQGNLQVPLPQPPHGSQDPVVANFQLSLDRTAKPPKGWTGSEVLLLPVPDVPLSDDGLTWRVEIQKGFVLSQLDPRDGRRPLRPFRTSAALKIRGFLPTRTTVEDKEAISLQVRYLAEGTMLGLFALLGLGVLLLAAGLPLLMLGRLEFGLLPRVAVLALIGAGGVLVLEAEIPLPAWVAILSALAGGVLGIGLLIRSWSPRVLALLLLAPGFLQAAPGGLDFRYLPAETVAAKTGSGEWSVRTSREIMSLSRRAHQPEPAKPEKAESTLPPRIRNAEHRAEIRGEAAHVRSRYTVEGRSTGPWPLLLDFGPDAAIRGLTAKRSGRELSGVTLVPEGGPGTPGRGHPRPGVFRVRGLSGENTVTLEVDLVLPAALNEGGGTFQVTGLPSPGSRFEVVLPEQDVHVEVYPTISSSTDRTAARTRVRGWLKPASTFAVRWTARSGTRKARPEQESPTVEASRFDAEVFPRFVLDGRRLTGTHRIQVNVTQGALDQLRLRIPAGSEVLSVSGPGIARHVVGEPDGETRPVDVLLTARKSGTWTMNLVTLRILGDEEQAKDRLRRKLTLGELVVEGAQKQSGDVRLDLPPGVTPLALAPEGATRIDPRETRPRAPASSLVFRYLTPGYRIGIGLERFPAPLVRELVGRRGSVRVVPLGGGLSAHVAKYVLTSRGNQSLALVLPEKARLVSTQVNGRPVKAGRAGAGRFRVPLTGGTAPASQSELTLDFVYIAPTPTGSFVPPNLPDTTLESLTVELAHRDDRRLRVAGGPYRVSRGTARFFEPVHKVAKLFPAVVLGVVTAPVTIPLSMLTMGASMTMSASRGRRVDRLLDEVGASLEPMSPPPPPSVAGPGRAGGGAFARQRRRPKRRALRERAQRMDMNEQVLRSEEEMLLEGGEMDDDGFADMQAPAEAPAPAQMAYGNVGQLGGYAVGDDLLVGEGFQGSLPVPLDFRAQDLRSTGFSTQLLAAGEAPVLRLASLPRWKERLLLLLSVLLAAAGTFLLLGGQFRAAPGAAVLVAGLSIGLWLSWSHGAAGGDAWSGVALGLLLALLNRIRMVWLSRGDAERQSDDA